MGSRGSIAVLLLCGACKSGSDSADAASADAGTLLADGGRVEADPEVRRVLEAIAQAGRGEPADLDGDGVAELTRSAAGAGPVQVRIDRDGNGTVEAALLLDAQGNGTWVVDADQDGVNELEATFSQGPPPTRIFLRDTNFDGRMDRRQTESFTELEVHLLVETDPDGDGIYAVSADELRPLVQGSSSPNPCQQGFPCDTAAPPARGVGDDIRVLEGGDGRCSTDQAERIEAGIRCAMTQGMQCLSRSNPELFSLLAARLTGSGRPMVVACSNSCAGNSAQTESRPFPLYADGEDHTNVNPSETVAYMANDMCSLMLHEMLHWAGAEWSSSTHDVAGTDAIYSCARFCAGCADHPHPSGMGPGRNSDCMSCASDPGAQRKLCFKTQYQDGTCPVANGFCHGGLSTSDCLECKTKETRWCDDSVMSAGQLCCATCPEGSNEARTDFPCGSMSDQGGCEGRPPGC